MRKITLLRLIIIMLQCSYCALAIDIDLSKNCSDAQVEYCTLSSISATYDDPFVLVNNSVPLLQSLVIRNSVLQYVRSEIFERAPNLHTLIMHNCGVYRINRQGTQLKLPKNLTKLVLQKNRISRLTEPIFTQATELEQLLLGYNIIHTVHRDAFNGLSKLRYLDLQSNGIRTLMDGALTPLVALEQLDLSGNELDKIDQTTFEHNLKLQTLLLSGNKFSVFEPHALNFLPQLHYLDLSNCALDELHLSSLHTLLVSSSGLSTLDISGGINKVVANNNDLTNFKIGDPSSIRVLDLHSNLFETCNDFTDMSNLQYLDLSKNRIKSLSTLNSPLYLPLESLTYLNLAVNQLENLSADNLLLLQRLNHLDVSFNHGLRLKAKLFEPLINLERLFIEGVRLHNFDYELLLRNHAHLKEIGLCDNEWEYHFMRKMVTYLKDRGVHFASCYTKRDDILAGFLTKSLHSTIAMHETTSEVAAQSAEQRHIAGEPGGIHPYWTTRDVLTLSTLLIVLLILLIQLYGILRKERRFAFCMHRRSPTSMTESTAALNHALCMVEDDSEV